MKVLMITRAEQFSPNSVERDRAIIEAVAARLRQAGHDVTLTAETTLPDKAPEAVLTMGRLPQTLDWLRRCGARLIINSPDGIANCGRSRLEQVMTGIGTPKAPQEGPDGYWLKRGDAAAQEPGDVVYAQDREALMEGISGMERRGITDYTVSAHVRGDLVKFYGVRGTGFFRCHYPTDDGQSKFGDERRNGTAHHYPFSHAALQTEADRLAEAVGIEVYGGDCIVKADGSFCLIDFNDWPSFSRCREEAAEAIASLIH